MQLEMNTKFDFPSMVLPAYFPRGYRTSDIQAKEQGAVSATCMHLLLAVRFDHGVVDLLSLRINLWFLVVQASLKGDIRYFEFSIECTEINYPVFVGLGPADFNPKTSPADSKEFFGLKITNTDSRYIFSSNT